MNRVDIDNLVDQFRSGNLSRRGFMRRATALGISATAAGTLAQSVLAQDATPRASPMGSPAASPVGTGEIITSISREDAQANLDAAFDFEQPQNQGGQVILTNTTDISTVNTVLASDVYSGWITGMVYDSLVGVSVADGSYVPGLADSWEIAEDGVTYTLKLHEGVKWHDGEPFTADDVIFTYDAALADNSTSVRKGTIDATLASYEKIDDHTVKFVSKEPSAIFLSEGLSQFGMMPKHIWQDVDPGDWASDPGSTGQDPTRVIGTGAFKFVEWQLGDHATVEKNADYWDTPNIPVIDTFIHKVVAEATTAISELQTGETDVIEVPFQQANDLKESNPDLQVNDFDTFSFNFYLTNQDEAKGGIFTDVNVRQALQYALDRELLAETVYFGYAVRADGTQPVLSIAYDPDRINTIYTFEPDKAKSMLDEAGWTVGSDGIREKDGQRLSFEATYSEGAATYLVQIPYMQQAWREVGVEMLPSAIPFPTLLDNNDAGNFDMSVMGFSWDATGAQDAMFASYMTPPNGFNMMRYSNPDYDALVDPSKSELDQDKRVDILIEMTNIVNDDMAAGITVFRKSIYGGSPRLHNFFPNGYGEVWWINRAWVDAE